jgi:hypothetical protein
MRRRREPLEKGAGWKTHMHRSSSIASRAARLPEFAGLAEGYDRVVAPLLRVRLFRRIYSTELRWTQKHDAAD